MTKYILLIFLFSTQSFAVCTKPVTLLEEGAKTECRGYLFTPEKELETRIKITNYDNMEELVDRTEELNTIIQDRLTIQIDQNQKLLDTLNRKEQWTTLQNVGFFILGVVVTGYITSNVSR